MEHFSYSFVVTLFHSFWQLALLLGAYRLLGFHLNQSIPLARRNFLFTILLLQVLSSAATFILYYTNITDGLLGDPGILPLVDISPSYLQLTAPYIAFVYVVAVIFKLVSHCYRWQYFNKHTAGTVAKVPASMNLFTQLKAAEFGITRQVTLWYSTAVHTPVVYGFIKPVILLPISLATKLSLKETETILIHELTHIRNNDYLLNWFLIIAENFYFFNPFMKVLASSIRMEREKACDVQVLMFKYTAVEYAAALLTTARLGKKYLSFQLGAVTEKSLLLHRIQYFSNYKLPQRRMGTFFPLALAFILFAGSFLGLTKTVLHGDEIKNHTSQNKAQKIHFPAQANHIQKDATLPTTATNSEKQTKVLAEESTVIADRPALYKKNSLRGSAGFTEKSIVQPISEFQPTTVAFPLNKTNDSARQVIINEENSNGQVLTRAYKVKLVNGQWVSEPLWVLSEQHPRKDSVFVTADSAFRLIPAVQ